jgi:hypothetical protein
MRPPQAADAAASFFNGLSGFGLSGSYGTPSAVRAIADHPHDIVS